MIRYLAAFLLAPGFLFGFTSTRDTLYSPSLTNSPTYNSAQLFPSKNAISEILDSIKFSGDALTTLGELPKVQLEINGKTVDCLDSTPCRYTLRSKVYTDTLNRLNGQIRFKAMADCFACPTSHIGNDCACRSTICQNAVLYLGYLKVYSGGSILNITLIGTTFKCGGSYKNPLDPSAVVVGKANGRNSISPKCYELNGKKVSKSRKPTSPIVLRVK